eukprot:4354405-Prymnesium_polylepis.1
MASPSFHALCEAHTLVCAASLFTPPSGRRGLYAGAPVRTGQPLVAVPWDLTLNADITLDEATEDGVLPHLATVASELLRAASASSEDALSPRERFWREWSLTQLPRPSELTHPATLAPSVLAAVQDDALERAAQLRRTRVASLLAGAAGPLGEAWSHWAFAMVSSRPFRIAAPESPAYTAGASAPPPPPKFAFVPFIDMANHDAAPNVEVRAVGAVGGGAYEAVELVALRDLAVGEEATISYELEQMDAAAVYLTFGFVIPEAHAND